jgi:hypothetical protein
MQFAFHIQPGSDNRAVHRAISRPGRWQSCVVLLCILLASACSTSPVGKPEQASTGPICDSYLVFAICVRDLVGDGAVDMIYFANSERVFMYRREMKDQVEHLMPLHHCAVSLDEQMQTATNRILHRNSLSMGEKLGIKRLLLVKYLAAKPEIDACNARRRQGDAEKYAREKDFYMGESDWEKEPDTLYPIDSGWREE